VGEPASSAKAYLRMSFAGGFAMDVSKVPTTNTTSNAKGMDDSLHRGLTLSPGTFTSKEVSLPPLLNNNAFVKQYNEVVSKEKKASPRAA